MLLHIPTYIPMYMYMYMYMYKCLWLQCKINILW